MNILLQGTSIKTLVHQDRIPVDKPTSQCWLIQTRVLSLKTQQLGKIEIKAYHLNTKDINTLVLEEGQDQTHNSNINHMNRIAREHKEALVHQEGMEILVDFHRLVKGAQLIKYQEFLIQEEAEVQEDQGQEQEVEFLEWGPDKVMETVDNLNQAINMETIIKGSLTHKHLMYLLVMECFKFQSIWVVQEYKGVLEVQVLMVEQAYRDHLLVVLKNLEEETNFENSSFISYIKLIKFNLYNLKVIMANKSPEKGGSRKQMTAVEVLFVF